MAPTMIDVAFRRYNLALGAGLSKVAGKLFRIGHLGDLNELMLMAALAGAEMAMLDVRRAASRPAAAWRRIGLLASHDPCRSTRQQGAAPMTLRVDLLDRGVHASPTSVFDRAGCGQGQAPSTARMAGVAASDVSSG